MLTAREIELLERTSQKKFVDFIPDLTGSEILILIQLHDKGFLDKSWNLTFAGQMALAAGK
jgi:hypothetical protein